MKETGIEFDMNPETFTLNNLFAMELHRFNESIQVIVTSASKELQIEKVIQILLITSKSPLSIKNILSIS